MAEIQFSDDHPKLNVYRHDTLGFRPFAERMSKVLLRLRAPEGYVIGLHGVWGSGKTTAINFVLQLLDKHNQEAEVGARLQYFQFQPWLVSGHTDLIGAFFKVLAEEMDDRGDRKQFFAPGVSAAAEPIIDAAATIGAFFDPTGGFGSKAVSEIAKRSIKGRVAAWQEVPSIQSSYQRLRDQLAERKRSIVVFIDDVDRLTKSEIRHLMQMVKSVGRLPHVIMS